MPQNPWEMDWSAPAPPAAAPTPPAFIPGTVSPMKARDQQLQESRDAREARRLELAEAEAARSAQKDAEGTESERTAGFLTGRIVDAVGRMGGAIRADRSAQAPTLGVEAVRRIAGESAANYLTDAERQQARAAEMDILDAALTLGTGAAYTREQLEGYRTSYFPQLGDDVATIASKRAALRSLLVNARTKAGKSAPDIDGAISTLDALNQAPADAKLDPNAEYDEHGNIIGLTGSVTDDRPGPGSPPSPPVDPTIAKLADMEGDQSGLAGIGTLAAQGAMLGLSDEAAGIGGYISGLLTGKDPMKEYERSNAARDLVIQRARQASPIAGTAAELLGGGGAARFAGNALTMGQAVRQGAGVGALSGFGYGEGAQESVNNAMLGAGVGGAIGGGLQRVGNALTARANRPGPDLEVAAAGQRQGIPIRQPDARPELRGRYAAAESTQTGGPEIRAARAADTDAIEQRVGEIGGRGTASDPYGLGSRVQEAGNRYIARTRQQANRLYDRARQEAGGTTVEPTEAIANVDKHIAELRAAGENSNGAAISYLEGLRDDLSGASKGLNEFMSEGNERFLSYRSKEGNHADIHLIIGTDGRAEIAVNANAKSRNNQFGPAEIRRVMSEIKAKYPEIKSFYGERETGAGVGRIQSVDAGTPAPIAKPGLTIESVQNLRTNMRGQLSERGLTGTDAERRVREVIDAANMDLARDLPRAASQTLRAADDFYRERQQFITGTLQQFMGSRGNPLPAETAAKRLVSMAQGKGNHERFGNMWRELSQTERDDAAATIAASLGRQQNGNFSPAMLIKSLDPRNGLNPRTARLVFGEDGARALNDLRVIARAKGEAMNRQSPSGQTIAAQAGNLKTLLMGALGFSAGGPGGAAAGAVGREFLARWGEQRAARMLLNPDFTRWLRRAPQTANPRAIDRYFRELSGITSVAANDNAAFIGALRESAARSSAAASPDQE